MEKMIGENMQWLAYLLAATALHGIWLATLLFSKAKQSSEAKLLGIAFVIVSLHLLNFLIFLTGYIRLLPHGLGFIYPLLFLVGPIFYFFVKKALEPGFQIAFRHWWHLILPCLAFFDTLDLYLLPTERKLAIIEYILSGDPSFTWKDIIKSSAFQIQLAFYVAAAWWQAKHTEGKQENEANRKIARWYKRFCEGYLLLILIEMMVRFVCFSTDTPNPVLEMVAAAILALTIQLAGYGVIHKLWDFPRLLPILPKASHREKYKTSPITPQQMDASKKALLELMENDTPHLNPSLKISDLALMLGIPSHHLSQILNEGMRTNFYDFVNTYRIEDAKCRLKDKNYSHYSILAIGLDCGFSNKTTFNRTFKKITGMTPSAYAASKNVSLR